MCLPLLFTLRGKSSPAKDSVVANISRELPGPEPGVTKMFSSFSKGSTDKCLFSVWGNLPEGCPEQRKTLSLGQLLVYLHDITGPHLVFFFWNAAFSPWGISQLGVHYSVTSYPERTSPSKKVSGPSIFPFYKKNSVFILTQAAPAQTVPMCPIGRHIHPTKAVNKHTPRRIFGLTVSPSHSRDRSFCSL